MKTTQLYKRAILCNVCMYLQYTVRLTSDVSRVRFITLDASHVNRALLSDMSATNVYTFSDTRPMVLRHNKSEIINRNAGLSYTYSHIHTHTHIQTRASVPTFLKTNILDRDEIGEKREMQRTRVNTASSRRGGGLKTYYLLDYLLKKNLQKIVWKPK